MQQFRGVFVGKADVLKADISIHGGIHGIGVIGFHGRIHNIEDTVNGNTGLAHFRDHTTQLTDGPDQHGIVGDEGNVRAFCQTAADTKVRTENHNQHHLNAGEDVGYTPEAAHDFCHFHPQGGIVAVLLRKFLQFLLFLTEGTHHPHAGKIFLRHGRELSLVFVTFHEGRIKLVVKVDGVADDQGHRNQRNDGQHAVHGSHEGNGQNQQDYNAENTGQLLGQEVFRGFNVRGAALNDITGTVFHVPGEGEMLNVGKQPVTHGFDQSFGSSGIVHTEGVLAGHLKNGYDQNGQRHDPQVLSQIGKSADGIHNIHYKGRIICLLAAQCAVHRSADDLGLEHICQGCDTGCQNGNKEVPFRSFHKLPQKGEFLPALWVVFLGFHVFSPFLYVFSARWVNPAE